MGEPTPDPAARLAPLGIDSIHRALFAAYPDALVLADHAGTIHLVNPAAEALLGYTRSELIGMSIDALVPDGVRTRHAEHRASYAGQPRARPMGTHMELSARRRDGSEVMVEIALSPLDGHDPPLVVAAIRSIGDYPRVQQALQRARYSECVAEIGGLAVESRAVDVLLHEVPAAAARTLDADVALVYRLEPDGALRIAALHGAGGSNGGECEDQRHPNAPDTPWGYAMAQGEPVIVKDYRDETRFTVPPTYLAHGFVSAIAVPLADRGRITGLLSVRSRRARHFGNDEVRFLQSLAHLLAGSLQRADSEAALAHAQRLETVGQLSGGIAHDFNNLLTVIQGNLQVLEELPAMQDEGARELVAAAAGASRRGAELTAKLLAFSRRQMLQPTRIDVDELLGSLAKMLRRTLDARIRITVDVSSGCPAVLADVAQLESALLNLAINARDAMPSGGLLAFAAKPLKDGVALSVTDSGCGMSDEVRARAFEPFFTTKEKGRGTGLGLSTVYGFVTQSKGTVEIDSAPGRGTTVTLFIPGWRAAGTEDIRRGETLAAPAPGLRVLLVEDDAEVRKVIAAFLHALGCVTTTVADAHAALAVLEDGTAIDLLLSDVVLGPGLRGSELALQVQARWPKVATLLMSGYAAELLQDTDALSRRWDLLRKPCTRDDLARAIVRAMRTAA